MTINQITGTECGTEIAKIINRLISEKSDTDLGNLSAIGQAILDGKSSISLDNLSAAGQAILDKKVEVEALLQQNGYAKFTWKENNQISILLCWGKTSSSKNITLPSAYNNDYSILCSVINAHNGYTTSTYENGEGGHYKSLSSFYLSFTSYNGGSAAGAYWFTIGY